jgi:hypothetical protein
MLVMITSTSSTESSRRGPALQIEALWVFWYQTLDSSVADPVAYKALEMTIYI